MKYEELEQLVMDRVCKTDTEHYLKYGRSMYNEKWVDLDHVRWFVSTIMVKDMWEMTNKDKAMDCFDGTWPTCKDQMDVEQWLLDEDTNGTHDSEIVAWVDDHFGLTTDK